MERDATRLARDEYLALCCQHGEPGAFSALVAEMERPLLYFARSLLGDDDAALEVLQAVWLSAFRTIPRLHKPSAVRAWLYRLTRGKAIDRIRRERTRERIERQAAECVPEVADIEEPSFDQEDAAAVHRALATLDVAHREVLVLHFLDDLSIIEVADVVGCPPGTVKSRIFHAKRLLKSALLTEGVNS